MKSDSGNRPRVGVAVIVIKDGSVLMGRRINIHGEGSWQFPGGHLEFGESIEACAQREVFEETGVQIKHIRRGPYTNDVFDVDQKHYITLYVLAEFASGRPVLKEPMKCDGWRWVPWPPDVRPLFLPIRNLLKQGFTLFSVDR